MQVKIVGSVSGTIWEGPFEEFERANMAGLDAEEFDQLLDTGEFKMGGTSAAPLVHITTAPEPNDE